MSDDDATIVGDGAKNLSATQPVSFDGDAAARLTASSNRVTEMLSYLRSHVGSPQTTSPGTQPADGEWIKCDELVADALWLKDVIRFTGRVLGTDDEMVAASLFVQNYSYRVLTLGVAYALTSGLLPDLGAAAMAVSLRSGRPANVAFTSPIALVFCDDGDQVGDVLADASVRSAVIDFVLERAMDGHLAPLIDATRAQIRVGHRLLWGNVAASAAMAFRTMEGCLGMWVRPLGEQFFERGPAQLAGLGSFFPLEAAGNRGWYWERTNCCLHDRLESKIRCSDCSHTPGEERRRRFLDELATPRT